LRQFEPRTEVPDASVFGPLPQRLAPHIYREEEIVDLLAAARGLAPTGGLRPVTYETLFGLIASVGLRLSEALHLLDADVDLKLDRLTVRQTKFAKSRQLPIHTSVVGPLRRYRRIRNRHLKVTADMPFFVSKTGKVLSSRQVSRVFAQLRQQLGWVNRGAHHAPRIHDLRHNSETGIIPRAASVVFNTSCCCSTCAGSGT
jgi:integrase